jgi:hypothetical protein
MGVTWLSTLDAGELEARTSLSQSIHTQSDGVLHHGGTLKAAENRIPCALNSRQFVDYDCPGLQASGSCRISGHIKMFLYLFRTRTRDQVLRRFRLQ